MALSLGGYSEPQCAMVNSPRIRSQVEEQLDELSNVVSELREQIDRITSKLSPVTRDCPPIDCGKAVADDYLVPVADQIRNTRRRLQVQVSDLDSLFNRIEL